MNQEEKRLVRELLEVPRVIALGVLVEGAPYVGLLPFASAEDHAALFVHASALARHARGLTDGAPCSALVHLADTEGGDPLQVPRLTLQCEVIVLDPASPAHAAARARYLERFPQSAPTFELPDFQLYALRVREGRLVAGFARARNVSPGDLASV
jgi:putative heme iron utilization protein